MTTRRNLDAVSVALHVGALVIWPAAVGYAVTRLLLDRLTRR